MIELILGGEKSGKSDLALGRLLECPSPRLFVATGKALDLEFRRRIADHKRERDPRMPVLEIGADLAGPLADARVSGGTILVDSLDFWLFSALEAHGDEDAAISPLLSLLDSWGESVLLLVSCEVGLGPVAAGARTRAFVRAMGRLNREIAARAGRVRLCVAGLALDIKNTGRD